MVWFVYWDPCGLVCYAIGQITIGFVWFATMKEVIFSFLGLPAAILHGSLFTFFVSLVMWSHWAAACTPGGFTDKNTHTPEDVQFEEGDPLKHIKPKRRFCEACQALKPSRAHHCRICDRCIMRMDHHCPWVNNCVGQNNVKHFLQFLFYVKVGCTYAAFLFLFKLIFCMRQPGQCSDLDTESIVLSIIASLAAVFFAIFVIAMGCDQYEAMTTDTTGIESMQGWEELHETCGEAFSWRWFFPVTMPEASTFKTRPTDDPDAYSMRDPRVLVHFARLQKKGILPPDSFDEGVALTPELVQLVELSSDGPMDLQCTPSGVRARKPQGGAPPEHVGSPTNSAGVPPSIPEAPLDAAPPAPAVPAAAPVSNGKAGKARRRRRE